MPARFQRGYQIRARGEDDVLNCPCDEFVDVNISLQQHPYLRLDCLIIRSLDRIGSQVLYDRIKTLVKFDDVRPEGYEP
ncbi:unnamed protein product [Somion occarium]|uniref:Uncharacterized protein n=1 Tax=Somion occarium TaxID=3059160 RepID=A0ABP1E2K8_9APHY